jgi:hypothetical protein
MTTSGDGQTRRDFLKQTLVATAVLAAEFPLGAGGVATNESAKAVGAAAPWYRRALRCGQTNITEIDAQRYDVEWWRQHWKRTQVQGVIINAGGIFASYPSRFPLHHRSPLLGDRDLYGELAMAAHADGMAVLARMDSNRVHEEFYQAHPDWIARDAAGLPHKIDD